MKLHFHNNSFIFSRIIAGGSDIIDIYIKSWHFRKLIISVTDFILSELYERFAMAGIFTARRRTHSVCLSMGDSHLTTTWTCSNMCAWDPGLDMFKFVQLGPRCTAPPPKSSALPTHSTFCTAKHGPSESGRLAFGWNSHIYTIVWNLCRENIVQFSKFWAMTITETVFTSLINENT